MSYTSVHQSVSHCMDPDQAQCFVRLNLGLSYFADVDTGRQRVKRASFEASQWDFSCVFYRLPNSDDSDESVWIDMLF